MSEEIKAKANEFEKEYKIKTKKAWEAHSKFLELYPFKEHPEEIDSLTPDRIYNKGGDYFLGWIEHKLRDLGHLRIGADFYAKYARDNSEKFKELLRIAVDDNIPITEKIDSHWEDIKWFGGDKTIAKKIIFCYNPDKIIPIFKTEDLEHFMGQFHIDYKKDALESYKKSYELLTLGEKFEILNRLLMKYKKEQPEFKDMDNLIFVRLLYDSTPPQHTSSQSRGMEPLHPLGILFEPQYEQEVVYLFSIFHRDLGFPYIIKIRNEFPDAIVMDDKKDYKRIEFEVRASDFIQHKHDKKGCDFIICWENDLEREEGLPQIISLKDYIKEL
jgi:hypothetical protein